MKITKNLAFFCKKSQSRKFQIQISPRKINIFYPDCFYHQGMDYGYAKKPFRAPRHSSGTCQIKKSWFFVLINIYRPPQVWGSDILCVVLTSNVSSWFLNKKKLQTSLTMYRNHVWIDTWTVCISKRGGSCVLIEELNGQQDRKNSYQISRSRAVYFFIQNLFTRFQGGGNFNFDGV